LLPRLITLFGIVTQAIWSRLKSRTSDVGHTVPRARFVKQSTIGKRCFQYSKAVGNVHDIIVDCLETPVRNAGDRIPVGRGGMFNTLDSHINRDVIAPLLVVKVNEQRLPESSTSIAPRGTR